MKQHTEFLGHIAEGGKIYLSPLKTQAILKFPELKNAKQVQNYVALTGYFCKFVATYSIIARLQATCLNRAKNSFLEMKREKHSFI